MKETIRKLFCFVATLLMCASICGCSTNETPENPEEKQIKNTILEFQQSCNDIDVDGMLDCINPALVKMIDVLPGDPDKVLIAIIDLICLVDIDTADDILAFFESIRIDTESFEIEDDSATVDAVLSYTLDDETSAEDVTIKMIKKRGNWYLTFSLEELTSWLTKS